MEREGTNTGEGEKEKEGERKSKYWGQHKEEKRTRMRGEEEANDLPSRLISARSGRFGCRDHCLVHQQSLYMRPSSHTGPSTTSTGKGRRIGYDGVAICDDDVVLGQERLKLVITGADGSVEEAEDAAGIERAGG